MNRSIWSKKKRSHFIIYIRYLNCILLSISRPMSNENRKTLNTAGYQKPSPTELFSQNALLLDMKSQQLFQFGFSTPNEYKSYFQGALTNHITFGCNILITEPRGNLLLHTWTNSTDQTFSHLSIVRTKKNGSVMQFIKAECQTECFHFETSAKNVQILQFLQEPTSKKNRIFSFKMKNLAFTLNESLCCDKTECVSIGNLT